MNKKILLGVGSLAAAALPVSVVVACNDDKKDGDETPTPEVTAKTAVVTVASPSKVAATVAGTGNAYTLSVLNTDTINKTELETALKGMVAKNADDGETPTFAGTWDTAFDGSKNAIYTYTIKAEGYTDVTFEVTVTGNAVNGAITLNEDAKLKNVAVTGSGPYAVTLPNGTTLTTNDVKALFDGKGMLAVADTDNYDATTAKAYTFTITDPGTNSGTIDTATIEVTVAPVAATINTEAAKLVAITANTKTYANLQSNLKTVATTDVKADLVNAKAGITLPTLDNNFEISKIIVTATDGSNTVDYKATVSEKSPGTGTKDVTFTVTYK